MRMYRGMILLWKLFILFLLAAIEMVPIFKKLLTGNFKGVKAICSNLILYFQDTKLLYEKLNPSDDYNA